MKQPQTRSSLISLFVLLAAYPAFAGHGFMSAFGNIEWLPEPGRTPDSAWYTLDTWYEEGQLWLAATPQEKFQLALAFAGEKLAEAESMLTTQNTAAAQIATNQYWYYIDRAEQAIATLPGEQEEIGQGSVELVERLATALLEHQYILTIIYTDLTNLTNLTDLTELTPESRSVLREVFTTAQKRYAAIADRLPRKTRGALFFKEEEVRWYIAMAIRTDEQSR